MALRREGYWDDHYKVELKNFDKHGDEGEIWFGLRLTRRIIEQLLSRFNSQKDITLLDIGCGNSALLCLLVERLREEGLTHLEEKIKLVGIDYSKESIALAQRVVHSHNLDGRIILHQSDILNPDSSKCFASKYQYLVDKGTLDAICLLHGETDDELNRAKARYLESIYSIVEEGSVFILASCNNTEEELLKLFDVKCNHQRQVKLIGRIETPKITFGGKEGSQVCCIIVEFGHEIST